MGYLASRKDGPEDFVRYTPGHLMYGTMPLYIQSLPVIGQDEASTPALFSAIVAEHPGVYKNARIVSVVVTMNEDEKKREIPGMMPQETDPRIAWKIGLGMHATLLGTLIRRLSFHIDELATVLQCQGHAGCLTEDATELRNAIERMKNELT